jgi:predicted ATPase
MTSSTEPARAQGQKRGLLERETERDKLEQCLERVGASATGMVAFIGGEAGVGKTALVRELCEHAAIERVLRGACEPLLTRRPLGPFIELADAIGGDLGELVDGGAKAYPVASAILRELASGDGPTLVVLEDLHWGDEATLDVLRLTARRLAGVGCLLVVTYRNDELGPWHPSCPNG